MANISVTYSFSNGSTADATEVNTNFQDIIDGTSDGTKDLSVNAITAAGTTTLNGNVNLGNATSDDVTVTGRIASDLDPKTAATNTLGDATQTWQGLYLDNGVTDGGAVYFNASSTAFLKSDASGADLDLGGFTGLDLGAGCRVKTFGTETSAKSADYTVTDTDGIGTILMTAGSSGNVTVTLPTASANTGRIINIKKVDAGTAGVVIDGEGSETIDGYASTTIGTYSNSSITGQYAWMTVQCDGTGWHTIGAGNDYLVATVERTNSGVSSGVTANITSISTPAGSWEVSGQIMYLGSGTGTIDQHIGYISTSSASLPATGAFDDTSMSYWGSQALQIDADDHAFSVPPSKIALSSTTTIYMGHRAGFSGLSSLGVYGRLNIKRIG